MRRHESRKSDNFAVVLGKGVEHFNKTATFNTLWTAFFKKFYIHPLPSSRSDKRVVIECLLFGACSKKRLVQVHPSCQVAINTDDVTPLGTPPSASRLSAGHH